MADIQMKQLNTSDIDDAKWIKGPRHRQYLRDAVEKTPEGKSNFYGVWKNGELISYCGIRYDTTPDAGYLTMLTVREEFQGQGYGTKFVKYLEDQIVDFGREIVELSVEESNPRAFALYIRLGYEAFEKREETWEEDTDDGGVKMYSTMTDVMRKQLV